MRVDLPDTATKPLLQPQKSDTGAPAHARKQVHLQMAAASPPVALQRQPHQPRHVADPLDRRDAVAPKPQLPQRALRLEALHFRNAVAAELQHGQLRQRREARDGGDLVGRHIQLLQRRARQAGNGLDAPDLYGKRGRCRCVCFKVLGGSGIGAR